MATEQQTELPFEQNLDSFSRWLAGLPLKERERYAGLFSGLQALNGAKPKTAFYLMALEKLRGPVFEASDNLAAAFLGKPQPLDPGIRKLAKLSVQFQSELAEGYFAVTQAKGFGRMFGEQEQGRVVHRALRSYAQMLLRMALMHEAPPRTTWLRLNEIYRLAEHANVLVYSDACSELPHSALCSVEQLYLRMLAFRLATPYRLGEEDIQRVFDLVQQHGELLSLSHQSTVEGNKADFAVDLESGLTPCSLSREEGDGKGDLRYLFLGRLRQALAALGRPPLNKDAGVSAGVLNHLLIRLGANLGFLSDKKSRGSALFAGYKNLVAAMNRPQAKLDFKLQDFDEHLLPFASFESSKTTGTFRLSAGQAKLPLSIAEGHVSVASGFPCHVYPANVPGFYIVESSTLDLRAGRLLGLFTDDKLIQFGLVCPGLIENAPNAFGFELLAVQVALVKVCFDANPKKNYRCFLSSMGNGRFSLITEPFRLRGGDGMGIKPANQQEVGRYHVVQMLEKTAEFCQFEIVPEQLGQKP